MVPVNNCERICEYIEKQYGSNSQLKSMMKAQEYRTKYAGLYMYWK